MGRRWGGRGGVGGGRGGGRSGSREWGGLVERGGEGEED